MCCGGCNLISRILGNNEANVGGRGRGGACTVGGIDSLDGRGCGGVRVSSHIVLLCELILLAVGLSIGALMIWRKLKKRFCWGHKYPLTFSLG